MEFFLTPGSKIIGAERGLPAADLADEFGQKLKLPVYTDEIIFHKQALNWQQYQPAPQTIVQFRSWDVAKLQFLQQLQGQIFLFQDYGIEPPLLRQLLEILRIPVQISGIGSPVFRRSNQVLVGLEPTFLALEVRELRGPLTQIQQAEYLPVAELPLELPAQLSESLIRALQIGNISYPNLPNVSDTHVAEGGWLLPNFPVAQYSGKLAALLTELRSINFTVEKVVIFSNFYERYGTEILRSLLLSHVTSNLVMLTALDSPETIGENIRLFNSWKGGLMLMNLVNAQYLKGVSRIYVLEGSPVSVTDYLLELIYQNANYQANVLGEETVQIIFCCSILSERETIDQRYLRLFRESESYKQQAFGQLRAHGYRLRAAGTDLVVAEPIESRGFLNFAASCYVDSLLIILFLNMSAFWRQHILLTHRFSTSGCLNLRADEVPGHAAEIQRQLQLEYQKLRNPSGQFFCTPFRELLRKCNQALQLGTLQNPADVYVILTDLFPDLKLTIVRDYFKWAAGTWILRDSTPDTLPLITFAEFMEAPHVDVGQNYTQYSFKKFTGPILVFQNAGYVIREYDRLGAEIGISYVDGVAYQHQVQKIRAFGEIILDRYQLMGVIILEGVEFGREGGTHYTCYFRDRNNKWKYYDDLNPRIVTVPGVPREGVFLAENGKIPQMYFYAQM